MTLPEPYYQDEACTIYNADCREILPLLPKVDLVLTDPPYGETSLEWDTWPNQWPELISNLTNQLWCFGSFRMFLDKSHEFDAWRISQDLIWEKHNGSGMHTDRFRRVHELMVLFYRGNWDECYHRPVMTFDATKRKLKRATKPEHWGSVKSNGVFSVEEGGPRLMRSVIYARSSHMQSSHPTQKPISIVKPLLEYSLSELGVVLDPFMGSGTTLRAAKDLGRKSIGIEINREYCEIAKQRLAQEVFAL